MPIKRVDVSKYESNAVFEEEVETEMSPRSQSLQKGVSWDDFDTRIRSGSEGLYFKSVERPSLISFPRPEAIDIFDRHWVQFARKYVRCTGERCPLCAVGNESATRVLFEVVHFEEMDGQFDDKQKLWDCPPGTAKTLRAINADEFKGGPVFRNFFTVYLEDKRNIVTPIKKRDLEDPPWRIPTEAAVQAVLYATENPLDDPEVDMEAEFLRASELASKIRTSA